MNPDSPTAPRTGGGHLGQEWQAKLIVQRRKPGPFSLYPWRQRIIYWIGCTLGLAAVVAAGLFSRWYDAERTELARQRTGLASFLRSDEFHAFVAAADRQMFSTMNFVAARPELARAALAEVTAYERAHLLPRWTNDLMPLPPVDQAQPSALIAAERPLIAILCRHGFKLDENRRLAARTVLVGALLSYARNYVRRAPEHEFDSFPLDRGMQEMALSAYAATHGPGVTFADAEHLFCLYSAINPVIVKYQKSPHSLLPPAPLSRSP